MKTCTLCIHSKKTTSEEPCSNCAVFGFGDYNLYESMGDAKLREELEYMHSLDKEDS